jgi:single-strand DNA-binding protein
MAGKSLNKVQLIGNLGKDPEVRYTAGGQAVATFSIATNESWKDKEGNLQEKTEWHNVVAWQRLAEICGEYLKKGKKVYIEGRLQTRNYEDKEGVKRYVTEIVAQDMILLGSREGGDNGIPAPPPPANMVESHEPSTKADDLPF